jgi:integrase
VAWPDLRALTALVTMSRSTGESGSGNGSRERLTRQQDQQAGKTGSLPNPGRCATLRAALNTAIRHGLITGNPARHVELPPARRPHAVVWTASRVAHWRATGERPPVAVWTAAQTAQFLHAIRGDRLYAAFHLIALRGLRRGEAAGLRWCDVDLDEGVAVISQQLQQYDGHMVTCPPKTSHSARVIALDHTTVAALRRHRARQHAEQHQPGHHDSGYVFTGLGGDPLVRPPGAPDHPAPAPRHQPSLRPLATRAFSMAARPAPTRPAPGKAT